MLVTAFIAALGMFIVGMDPVGMAPVGMAPVGMTLVAIWVVASRCRRRGGRFSYLESSLEVQSRAIIL